MDWPFSLEMKVLFRDLDAMAHVNNAVYFTYLEQARTEYYFKMIGKTKVYDLDFIVAYDYKKGKKKKINPKLRHVLLEDSQ